MADPAVDSGPATEDTSVGANAPESKLDSKDTETATADADSVNSGGEKQTPGGPIVSSSKRTRPSYKFDPDKITLRFLFANNDGLTVTIECTPSDTVGEVKASLMSVWPDSLPQCKVGNQLRLVCMGKGYLDPDARTLQECEIPVFKTHPTPINVSVRPEFKKEEEKTLKKKDSGSSANNRGGGRSGQAADSAANTSQVDQGCACLIL
mmetsp:Transcript_19577/g.25250  ORF Transcript_19577/g.25250 Transcript_19577/m.25250 type:complete len:208 (-) Transcript_19577:243-866(-)|eukprot:CAMPEP_0198153010 /NCGR_PEP_ID=MMETSP1443-20131203/62200_1 /TAXON_ID=186043 /ORGANISM="Entomoneis sp., Strain CCMP2396" /LENGTH=207 /DNA_ID=CAMNT_0043819185 /DNA_START=468 /DNA_END=1091 /DNA_ORIENTATION=+